MKIKQCDVYPGLNWPSNPHESRSDPLASRQTAEVSSSATNEVNAFEAIRLQWRVWGTDEQRKCSSKDHSHFEWEPTVFF